MNDSVEVESGTPTRLVERLQRRGLEQVENGLVSWQEGRPQVADTGSELRRAAGTSLSVRDCGLRTSAVRLD